MKCKCCGLPIKKGEPEYYADIDGAKHGPYCCACTRKSMAVLLGKPLPPQEPPSCPQ